MLQQIISYSTTVIFLLWLFIMLFLFWKNADRTNRLYLALDKTAKQSAESAQLAARTAQKAVEAANLAIANNRRLIALFEAQQQKDPDHAADRPE